MVEIALLQVGGASESLGFTSSSSLISRGKQNFIRSERPTLTISLLSNSFASSRCANDGNTLGVFQRLPREVLDEIFGYIFAEEYLVCYSVLAEHERKTGGRVRLQPSIGDFALFRASSVVSKAALTAFYSSAIFKFDLWFENQCLTPGPTQDAANLMQNIEFHTWPADPYNWMEYPEDLYTNNTVRHKYKATVKRFTGAAVHRKSCKLRFNDCSDTILSLLGTDFFQAFKEFTGFSTLRLEFESTDYFLYPDVDSQDFIQHFTEILDCMKSVLSPTLGPCNCELRIVVTESPKHRATKRALAAVTYHPRRFSEKALDTRKSEPRKRSDGEER